VSPLRLAALVAFLLAILAPVVSPAYGTSCVPLVEWNDVTYDGGMNLARAPMLYAAPGYLAILPGEPFTTSSLVLAAAPRTSAGASGAMSLSALRARLKSHLSGERTSGRA
jgi:hypothetical protein